VSDSTAEIGLENVQLMRSPRGGRWWSGAVPLSTAPLEDLSRGRRSRAGRRYRSGSETSRPTPAAARAVGRGEKPLAVRRGGNCSHLKNQIGVRSVGSRHAGDPALRVVERDPELPLIGEPLDLIAVVVVPMPPDGWQVERLTFSRRELDQQ